jgi:Family of unknown function (DUF695)
MPLPEPQGLRPDALAAFWQWWSSVKDHVAAAIANRTLGKSPLVGYISTAVHNLNRDLAWELGPGRTSQHNLTVTAEGNLLIRRLAAQWLAAAPPPDPTWEYHDSRQPSSHLHLEMAGHRFAPEDFAIASTYDENRERFGVVLFHPEFGKTDDRLALQAAFLTLDQLLGEDDVERWIGTIDAAKSRPPGAASLDQFKQSVEQARDSATGDHFVLGEGTSRDGKRVIIATNEALKQIDHLDHVFHLKVTIALRAPDANGFPGDEESRHLNAFEDQLEAALGDNAVHIGRATWAGRREIHLFVRDPAAASATVDAWRQQVQPWQATREIAYDHEWSAAKKGIYSMLATRRG